MGIMFLISTRRTKTLRARVFISGFGFLVAVSPGLSARIAAYAASLHGGPISLAEKGHPEADSEREVESQPAYECVGVGAKTTWVENVLNIRLHVEVLV